MEDGAGSSLSACNAVGGDCPQAESLPTGELVLTIYMRLDGLSRGKMSGLKGQVWAGSSGDLHRVSKVLTESLSLTTFYQGRWLGRDETGKAKVSSL